MAVGPDTPTFDPEYEAWDMQRRAAELRGTMEDTGDTYPVCDTCGYIGTSRTRDGDPCPECEERDDA